MTSAYAPAMIADMHRARQLAWELPGLGWDVEILSPDASYQQASCLDGDSGGFFLSTTPVHEVPRKLRRLFSLVGLGSIGWRALRPMLHVGGTLLATGRFDLAYFSTTQFPLFLLGPAWRRRFGLPYILDFHDPCYREESTPPVWAKRSLKHEASRRVAGLIESRSVSSASGLVAVSSRYLETLSSRYGVRQPPWVSLSRSETIPFGVLPRDLEETKRSMGKSGGATGDAARLVYVGAGGPVMERSFALLCQLLADLRKSDQPAVAGLRVELYGTTFGWREGEPRYLAEVAESYGVADLVWEDPRRISYRRSLELLLGADGALVLGVDDEGYMPSKLFTYAYSGIPLLALVRRDGPAFEAMRGLNPLGSVLSFGPSQGMTTAESCEVLREFLGEVRRRPVADRRSALEPFMAEAMARRHAALFERCLQGVGGEL